MGIKNKTFFLDLKTLDNKVDSKLSDFAKSEDLEVRDIVRIIYSEAKKIKEKGKVKVTFKIIDGEEDGFRIIVESATIKYKGTIIYPYSQIKSDDFDYLLDPVLGKITLYNKKDECRKMSLTIDGVALDIFSMSYSNAKKFLKDISDRKCKNGYIEFPDAICFKEFGIKINAKKEENGDLKVDAPILSVDVYNEEEFFKEYYFEEEKEHYDVNIPLPDEYNYEKKDREETIKALKETINTKDDFEIEIPKEERKSKTYTQDDKQSELDRIKAKQEAELELVKEKLRRELEEDLNKTIKKFDEDNQRRIEGKKEIEIEGIDEEPKKEISFDEYKKELIKKDKEKKEKEEQEKLERERLEKERQEQERLERERLEKERQEQERLERERLEKERQEQERLERERLEKEKQEQERLERERIEKERQEQERLERERIEKERQEQERLERERIEQERQDQERLERERIEKEKAKSLEEIKELEKLFEESRKQQELIESRIQQKLNELKEVTKEEKNITSKITENVEIKDISEPIEVKAPNGFVSYEIESYEGIKEQGKDNLAVFFGEDKALVRKYFGGTPKEIRDYNEMELYDIFYAYFDEKEKCTGIGIYNQEQYKDKIALYMFGKNLITMTYRDIVKLIKKNDYNAIEDDDGIISLKYGISIDPKESANYKDEICDVIHIFKKGYYDEVYENF